MEPTHGPRRPKIFRFSLRVWLVIVAVISCVLAWQSRRSTLSPSNVGAIGQVASLDEDFWEITWSPERDRMAMLGWEKPAVVKDTLTLETIETIGRGKKLIHFAFSPDKDVVAYCTNGKVAETLDRRTGSSIKLDVGNHQPNVAFSPDGRTLATGGYGTASHLWRVSDGEHLHRLDAGIAEGALTPVFSPDGRSIASGNRNGETRVFDVGTGEVIHALSRRSMTGFSFRKGRIISIRRGHACVRTQLGCWLYSSGP